jgi:choline dehydrogenase
MTAEADCDYVIVGSGAGGGTLASRLAESGKRVVLLEAGGDSASDAAPRLPADYQVPAFHPFASENPAMTWAFFARHYADDARQARDPKYVKAEDGVFYPRAATLGGCTAHNAMIFLPPPDRDWDAIAALTGDDTWRANRMARYLKRLEKCRHRPFWRWLARLGFDPTGHGWGGWLQTERALPRSALDDERLMQAIISTATTIGVSDRHLAHLLGVGALSAGLIKLGLKAVVPSHAAAAFEALAHRGLTDDLLRPFDDLLDPNDTRRRDALDGLCYTPLTTRDHARNGTRERLLEVQKRHPSLLRLELNALASRVIFDARGRCCGVEYRKGERLYRADSKPSTAPGELRTIHAAREVILAGGAFNTPQLLMLSGIGPRDVLAKHGITTRVELDGVGRNLQDRYEVSVINRMAENWQALDGARFDESDPLYQDWAAHRDGMYTSNGAAVAVVQRSAAAGSGKTGDLFCMALLADFGGYVPGYSAKIAARHDCLSWTVLKAYTNNRAGRVTLRSPDPRDAPEINFHYFEEGSDTEGADLKAVVEAIRFVRRLAEPLKQSGLIAEEEVPGAAIDDDAALAQFVRDRAWGHHASCSCAIGARESGGVLDSRFRVHGVQGLRVVDASVFPRIPGHFIAGAVYMVAEKAADVILAEA